MVVVPGAKTLPAGTPERVSVTDPELSEAVAVPSSASVTTIDVAVATMVRATFGGTTIVGLTRSTTVTVWVFVVTLSKTSLAVQVIVVVPSGKMLPAGTPERVTDATATLSVAVAVPIVASLTNAVILPASVERVMFAGTV